MRTIQVCLCVLTFGFMGVPGTASPQNRAPVESPKLTKPAAVALSKSSTVSTTGGDSTLATKLPVRRVVLYKSGVGYFEHVGDVRGDQTVRIDFTSSQLNDVLQSLTVLDLGGGRISGVNYNSEAPLSQRLGTLRLPLAEQTDLSKFYGALRGARLEVRNGTTVITGRLLSVERKTRVNGGTTLEVDVITLVSDSGEVRSVEITPAVGVRLAERDVNDEVGRYLGLLSSVRQEDLRRMTIATSGSGDRQLYVSYISEVPVWKTTYRIVLPSKPNEEPLLQGWAIVDNTVGEDWNDVELSLVAGAPQSFIQRLSQPYYTRRPVVALSEVAQLTPQTHESAMLGGLGSLEGRVTDATGAVVPGAQMKLFDAAGNLIGSQLTNDQGHYSFADLPAANYRMEVSRQQFQTARVNGLAVSGGRELTQDLALSLGSATTTVTVLAAPGTLNTETGEVANGPTIGSGRELGSGPGANRQYGVGTGGGVGSGSGGGTAGSILGGVVDSAPAAARVSRFAGQARSGAGGTRSHDPALVARYVDLS